MDSLIRFVRFFDGYIVVGGLILLVWLIDKMEGRITAAWRKRRDAKPPSS